MTKLRLANAARPALMLVVEGPPWTSSALVSGPSSQNCAREVRLAVVLSYRSPSLVRGWYRHTLQSARRGCRIGKTAPIDTKQVAIPF